MIIVQEGIHQKYMVMYPALTKEVFYIADNNLRQKYSSVCNISPGQVLRHDILQNTTEVSSDKLRFIKRRNRALWLRYVYSSQIIYLMVCSIVWCRIADCQADGLSTDLTTGFTHPFPIHFRILKSIVKIYYQVFIL